MKPFAILLIYIVLIINGEAAAQDMQLPLKDGEYIFDHKYAEGEQYKINSIKLIVKIKGSHIIVINNDSFDVFPKGVLEEGTLMWHSKSNQWIIGDSATDMDIDAGDIGGCSDGPTVIDFKKRIYWTC